MGGSEISQHHMMSRERERENYLKRFCRAGQEQERAQEQAGQGRAGQWDGKGGMGFASLLQESGDHARNRRR